MNFPKIHKNVTIFLRFWVSVKHLSIQKIQKKPFHLGNVPTPNT